MSAVTSPSEPAAADTDAQIRGMTGTLTLGFSRKGRSSRLADLAQKAPLRALFPCEDLGVPVAVVLNTAGGLVGGDCLTLALSVEAGAGALITSQAAEKVYRSLGPTATIDVAIAVGAGGWLEWLPQETILFDHSRLCRSTRIELAPDGRLIAAEIVVFGRRARGERFRAGQWREIWRVHRAGRLAWYDAQELTSGLEEVFASRACLDGAAAAATLICAAGGAPPPIETARALLADADGRGLRAGASIVNELLIVRWLSEDARRLRAAVVAVWQELRATLAGLPAAAPRGWAT